MSTLTKDALRAELNANIESFLADGGQIETIASAMKERRERHTYTTLKERIAQREEKLKSAQLRSGMMDAHPHVEEPQRWGIETIRGF